MGLTNQTENSTRGSSLQRFLEPLAHSQEAVSVRDVVNEDDAVGAAVVAFGDGPEPLLAGLEVHRKRGQQVAMDGLGGINQPNQRYSTGTACLRSLGLYTTMLVSNSH